MADVTWREAERRWRANPGDQAALAAAIAGHRREGLPVPPPLLDAQVSERTTFESELPLAVEVEHADGEVKGVGLTPSAAPVKVPRHRTWWVSATRRPGDYGVSSALPERLASAEEQDALVDEVARKQVPGIVLQGFDTRWLGALAARAPGLAALTLREGAGSIAAVSTLASLRYLDVSSVGPVQDLEAVGSLEEVVTLRAGLTALPALPGCVCRLDLSGGNALEGPAPGDDVDDRVARLGELEHLTRLSLYNRRLTEAGAKALARQAGRLVELNLGGTPLTDGGLRALAKGLTRLERLTLDRCDGLTDAGLAALARVSTLRALSLDHCRGITSRGIVKLAAIEGLKTLYVRAGARAAADRTRARARLAEALPGCKVY